MSLTANPSSARPSLKRVLICPGFRRCGTSSLHSLLRPNRALLEPYFTAYVRDDLNHAWRTTVHSLFFKGKEKRLKRLPKLAEEIARTIDPGPSGQVLITDENLIGTRLYHPDGRTIFDVAETALPILERAFAGADVAFRFQIRDWDDWINSSYAREVVRRGATYSKEEYMAGMNAAETWETGTKKIKDALASPVSFLNVTDDLIGGAPGRSILDHFDVPEEVIERLVIPPRQNVSPSSTELEQLRLRNVEKAG